MSTADNKTLVIAFYEQAFNDGQPEQAAAAHLGATYTQHNPGAPDGAEGFIDHYTRDEFLTEFHPDPADKADIAAGMEQLRAEQRAFRLAEMRRRLGITQAQVAARMGITQGRVSAIEHAKPGTTELRTLAAYVEALGGRLEIIADFGDRRLAFTEPGIEAA